MVFNDLDRPIGDKKAAIIALLQSERMSQRSIARMVQWPQSLQRYGLVRSQQLPVFRSADAPGNSRLEGPFLDIYRFGEPQSTIEGHHRSRQKLRSRDISQDSTSKNV